ncbi:hypothetical protein IT084_15305 [Desulfallas sp. Bu1-1]|nr:hypothetical protein [Desulfallas sp. Bu1-1]
MNRIVKYSYLTKPGMIGTLEVRNRVVMAPMGSGLAELGYPGDRIIQYYKRRAAGVGLLIIESSYVVPVPGVKVGHLSLASDTHLEAWRQLVSEIHQAGAAVGVQIQHPEGRHQRFLRAICLQLLPLLSRHQLVK